jgi:hypothetical protein
VVDLHQALLHWLFAGSSCEDGWEELFDELDVVVGREGDWVDDGLEGQGSGVAIIAAISDDELEGREFVQLDFDGMFEVLVVEAGAGSACGG